MIFLKIIAHTVMAVCAFIFKKFFGTSVVVSVVVVF